MKVSESLLFVALSLPLIFIVITQAKDQKSISKNMSSIDINSPLLDPLLKFSCNLFKGLNPRKNVIFSPLSVHMALNMILLGSDPGTETEKQLVEALGFKGSDKDGIQHAHEAYSVLAREFLKISDIGKKELAIREGQEDNFVFGAKTPILDLWTIAITKNAIIRPNYSGNIKKYFNTSIESIDGANSAQMRLLRKVNSWAKDAGYSEELLTKSDLIADFRMLLLSAVRVQAFWEWSFHEHKVKELFFNDGLKDEVIKDGPALIEGDIYGNYVEFSELENARNKLHRGIFYQAYGSEYETLSKLNFRAVEIPLDGDLTYVILEPLTLGNDELKKLTSALVDSNGRYLAKTLTMLNSSEARVNIDHIQMPKFNFETSVDLISPLKSMGISEIFDKNKAQLSNMSIQKLYVDKARHDAVIEVNKVGLKAAGITRIRAVPLMLVLKKERLEIDIKNPFLFVVRYKELPIFMGQLTNIVKQ